MRQPSQSRGLIAIEGVSSPWVVINGIQNKREFTKSGLQRMVTVKIGFSF